MFHCFVAAAAHHQLIKQNAIEVGDVANIWLTFSVGDKVRQLNNLLVLSAPEFLHVFMFNDQQAVVKLNGNVRDLAAVFDAPLESDVIRG